MSLIPSTPRPATDPSGVNEQALRALIDAGYPFLVGGGFAYVKYTGIQRNAKDLDLFIHRSDRDAVLKVLRDAGFATEVTFPHWLGKARKGELYVDLIYSSGNGIVRVDGDWFAFAPQAEVLGFSVRLVPVEEMIWSKAFVMERDRYDGADIAHLLRARGHRLDWHRMVRRFGPDWRVLMSHLVLFGYIYPDCAHLVPRAVIEELSARWLDEVDPAAGICRGTLLSRWQYGSDLETYEDALRDPRSGLSARDVKRWTAPEDEG